MFLDSIEIHLMKSQDISKIKPKNGERERRRVPLMEASREFINDRKD